MEGDIAAAMLYVVAYGFLLRIPSEALPLRMADAGMVPERPLCEGAHSAIFEYQGSIIIKLRRRKNRKNGSVLSRGCWCSRCKLTCPRCVIGPWLANHSERHDVFGRSTAASATKELRRRLKILKVAEADCFTLHGFRRGHAQDLLANGSSLCEILRAGEWKSAAFMAYLDPSEVEAAAVVEAHLVESSDEGED